MSWLFEIAIQMVADAFGEAVAKKRPWWVEFLASLGCLFLLGLIILAFWVLFVLMRP